MPANLNTVAVIGNLTRDPELRHTPSGTAVCNMRIAVNDRVKVRDEWTDVPYYFDVTVWAGQGEAVAQYMSKGSKIGVVGKLTWREWEAQDGTKRQAVEIVASNVQFLDSREGSSAGGQRSGGGQRQGDFQPPGSGSADFVPAASDDDIPF